ncbi:transposase [Sphingomonas sp. RB3P16]|uniref:transposase n=1 Tax=Parasphingomonas frigoris TaxID=3096163 RepID=UPI002FCBF0F5
MHATVDGHLTGRTTVAHSYFDKGALAAACRVHARPMIQTVWLDSVRVAKRAWPDLESHKLGGLARYLGIAHKHHDALSDARAAGWVIVKAIDHTGLSLEEWLAPPRKAGPAPAPTEDGPLLGQRIAILGEPRDGRLAQRMARHGGKVMSAVGPTTALLVVAGGDPIGRAFRTSATFLKAQRMRKHGATIRIVSEDALFAGL